jgi:hypothetical protein
MAQGRGDVPEIEMTWRFLCVVMGMALTSAGVARGQDVM